MRPYTVITTLLTTAGFISSPAAFGTLTLNAGTNDVFVAKLADAGSTGSFVWAQRAGGSSDDVGTELVVSGTSVYVAGSFSRAAATFGTITLTIPNSTIYLGFLASLTDPTLTATASGHDQSPSQLYPNPAHYTAILRLPAGTALAPLTLTDAQGRTVRHFPAPAGLEIVLDLQDLPAGLYLLRGAGPAQRLAVH